MRFVCRSESGSIKVKHGKKAKRSVRTIMSWIRKLIRNKSSEIDVRKFLDTEGFIGSSAKFDYLELHAIERPGWVQIYRFSVRVLDESERWRTLFGVIRDDQRNRRRVWLTESESEQLEKAKVWSEGLITLQRKPLTQWQRLFLTVFSVILGLAVWGAIISSLN